MNIEDLENAGFPRENWPEDLPMPDESTITLRGKEGTRELYRYQADIGGQSYAMEVLLDVGTVPDPAEGVGFMLNQFAYLWRTDKSQIATRADGACRRINF